MFFTNFYRNFFNTIKIEEKKWILTNLRNEKLLIIFPGYQSKFPGLDRRSIKVRDERTLKFSCPVLFCVLRSKFCGDSDVGDIVMLVTLCW